MSRRARGPSPAGGAGVLLGLAWALGCQPPADPPSAGDIPAQPLAKGETRTVDLRFVRLDVEGFARTLTLEELRALPPAVLESIWVLDLDLRPLATNALAQIRDMGPEEAATLPEPTRNLRTLLTMTPDNANLTGTNLEELIALSGAIGIPPAKALANLMGIGVTENIVPVADAADAFGSNLIATHPNAQTRPGPVDADHPDGLWPVPEGAIPVSMADVALNFANLPERFGPAGDHPGFVKGAEGVLVVEEDFRFTVKVDAQALPYKGVDLTNASRATVNSKPGQIETLFNFDDPDWMQIEGLVPVPRISELSLDVFEADGFIPGGTSQQPAPNGDSPVWGLDPWLFEPVIAEAARRWAEGVPAHCDEYELGTGVVAFRACVGEDGWVTMETFNNVGDPPAPAYLWDLLLEIAQVRLHDGGLAEGEADVRAIVQDVEVGVSADEVVEQIQANVRANPVGLKELVRAITDNTRGDADFYYVRARPGAPADEAGDWLFFITADDVRRNEDGAPVRDFADYERVGFFADPELADKVSSLAPVDGDSVHEKVRIAPGDVLYVGDDAGRVFRLDVGEKPSTYHVRLDVTRVQ